MAVKRNIVGKQKDKSVTELQRDLEYLRTQINLFKAISAKEFDIETSAGFHKLYHGFNRTIQGIEIIYATASGSSDYPAVKVHDNTNPKYVELKFNVDCTVKLRVW